MKKYEYMELISDKNYLLKPNLNITNTLLFGKTGDLFHHVFEYDNNIYVIKYDKNKIHFSKKYDEINVLKEDFIPEKVFSERSDYKTCNFIKKIANKEINLLEYNLTNVDGSDFNKKDIFISTGYNLYGKTGIKKIDKVLEEYEKNHVKENISHIDFKYKKIDLEKYLDKNQNKYVRDTLFDRMNDLINQINIKLVGKNIRTNKNILLTIKKLELNLENVSLSTSKIDVVSSVNIILQSKEDKYFNVGSLYWESSNSETLACLQELISFYGLDSENFDMCFSESGMQGNNFINVDFSVTSNFLCPDILKVDKAVQENNFLKKDI